MIEVKKSATALAEEEMLKLWAKEKTFEKSLSRRKGAERFNFNDGPPFANGLPHFGHSLVTAVKDSILRYKTMRGYYVPRRNGWDCHGLPVEYTIEKDFGVSGKKQILGLGLAKFNAACRDSIFKYKADWEAFLSRIGRWSDYQHYYATVDTNYTESVWWTLSQAHKKGLLYRGFKSLPYCPRCATPLSNFEINEGYRDNVPDPSVFVLFPLVDDPKTKILAWTTTPWTLPANAGLAVDKAADYAYVKLISDGSTLILARKRLDVLDLRKTDYKLLKSVKGKQLIGLRYESLYPLPKGKFSAAQVKNAYQVLHDDNISLEDGTGILHVAPRYGETDLILGQAEGLPLVESVDSSGYLIYGPKEALGKFFKAADRYIIADLTRKAKMFAAETAQHTYPFCWRCDTPLMYFATTTWFLAVTKIKDDLIKTAEQIEWIPANIKGGRFGKWLEGARDWAISRNRYWGAPMPIWQNVDNPEDYIVVDSIKQLKELAGDNIKTDDLHRPFIDEITFKKDGKTYKRIEEVLDCWFESGAMPAAQWHYPFENKEIFEKTFPADFITEAVDQTRLWFYVQHVIATILFDSPAYKRVIVTGFMMAADGQKLSKRLRNYPPVDEVFDNEGADALRLYLLSRTQATETADYMRFDRSAMTDIQRNVLDTLTNSFKFFKTYSEIDKWPLDSARGKQPRNLLDKPDPSNLLDKWILARLEGAIVTATKNADSYKIAHSLQPIFELIDDLSNWYIRRSRRRFWRPVHRSLGEGGKSENDKDKDQAYATLHFLLVKISQLMAPWAPFMSDRLWRELTVGTGAETSVHLSDWPSFAKASEGKPSINKPDKASMKLLEDMKRVRQLIINEGLSQRAAAGIKVRQPLAGVKINLKVDNESEFGQVIAEELNIKKVKWVKSGKAVVVDTKITPELKSEGIMRELVRNIQNARKNAGLNVDDRIKLRLETDDKNVAEAIKQFKDTIFAETLATRKLSGEEDYSQTVRVESREVKISLGKNIDKA